MYSCSTTSDRLGTGAARPPVSRLNILYEDIIIYLKANASNKTSNKNAKNSSNKNASNASDRNCHDESDRY